MVEYAVERCGDDVPESAVDNARFKQPVEPGDQLLLDVQIRRIKRGIGMFTGVARVDDKIVASAELMCARRGINI